MSQLTFQSTAGGQINLIGASTASTYNINVPAANGNLVTTGDTGTITTTMLASTTGSGAVVLATSPTLVTPALGTPSALVGTNITGTAAGLSIGGNAATATSATSATTATTATNQSGGTVSATSIAYSTTLTGGTGIVNLGSGQFYKDASGNVGVGTSSPAAKLDIGTGNLNFSSTSQRITGDFSNATTSSRVLFQSSTTNGNTRMGVIPNGTAQISAINFYNNSDPTNASILSVLVNASEAQLNSNLTGTGTYLPMTFYTGGSERMRLDTSGNVGIGTSSPNASAILDAQSTTKGVRMPNMTTTQKNAISSPAAGLMVFDTTLGKLCVYTGAAWQTITST